MRPSALSARYISVPSAVKAGPLGMVSPSSTVVTDPS